MNIALQDLKESNEFLNILLDSLNTAIFIVDKNIRLQKVNASFTVLFQKSEEKVLGELCGNALGCGYQVEAGLNCGETERCKTCKLRRNLFDAFTEKVPSHQELMVRNFYINEERVTKYFRYSTKYISYHGQEMVLIIVDDISELETQKLALKEKNELLTQLNEQKNHLLGVAAHDLRNPIGGIQSFSEMLLEYDFSDEEKCDLLNSIKETSEFSLNLLNELLDISKIESGNLNLNKEMVEFSSFVKDIVDFNQIAAGKKNIQLEMDYQADLKSISIDKNKIRQVFANFISNAIKYSKADTKTIVRVSAESSNLLVEIIDQGQGIPERELEAIFKPFETTSVQSTADEKSTGLGLAIVKSIVEKHEGRVAVKSEVGVGSNFSFTLPLS